MAIIFQPSILRCELAGYVSGRVVWFNKLKTGPFLKPYQKILNKSSWELQWFVYTHDICGVSGGLNGLPTPNHPNQAAQSPWSHKPNKIQYPWSPPWCVEINGPEKNGSISPGSTLSVNQHFQEPIFWGGAPKYRALSQEAQRSSMLK